MNINIIDNDNNHLASPPSVSSPFLQQTRQQQQSNQSSTIPPPPPTLVLPIPTQSLIKINSYDHRGSINEIDNEFNSALISNDVKLIKKLADKGHSSSQAWLGSSYFYGENGFKINNDKSYKWLKKSSIQDHPKGCFDLFRYYEQFNNCDKIKIEQWLEKSCNLGYEDALATYSIYLQDDILNYHNYQKSFNLFKLSAAMGVDNNCFTNLGQCIYEGKGHVVDYQEAYRLFYLAAHQYKELSSYFYLGQCLYYGHGVEKNHELAFQWLKKSHDNGIYYGTNALGLLYLRGHGVAQDFQKSKELFLKVKLDCPFLDIEINLKTSELCCLNTTDANNYVQENLEQPLKAKSNNRIKPNEKHSKKLNLALSNKSSEVLQFVGSTLDSAYQF